jgi:hypothetical protein
MGFQLAKHGNAASPICFCILGDIGGFGRLAAKALQIRASATIRQLGCSSVIAQLVLQRFEYQQARQSSAVASSVVPPARDVSVPEAPTVIS